MLGKVRTIRIIKSAWEQFPLPRVHSRRLVFQYRSYFMTSLISFRFSVQFFLIILIAKTDFKGQMRFGMFMVPFFFFLKAISRTANDFNSRINLSLSCEPPSKINNIRPFKSSISIIFQIYMLSIYSMSPTGIHLHSLLTAKSFSKSSQLYKNDGKKFRCNSLNVSLFIFCLCLSPFFAGFEFDWRSGEKESNG